MITWKNAIEIEPDTLEVGDFAASSGVVLPVDALSSHDHDPLVLVAPAAWETLWEHARSANVEVGGILLGTVSQDRQTARCVVRVEAAIPAHGGASSPIRFVFTPAAWDYISVERDRCWPELITVGWYHTHPGLSVFYSGTDRATQRAFFNRPWNVGIVVDPLARGPNIAIFAGAESQQLADTALFVLPEPVLVYDGLADQPTVASPLDKTGDYDVLVADEAAHQPDRIADVLPVSDQAARDMIRYGMAVGSYIGGYAIARFVFRRRYVIRGGR